MPPTTGIASSGKRFELPALDFKFSSLTEGTNIPPPPDSPIEKAPTPPETPVTDKKGAATTQTTSTSTTNGAAPATKPANGSLTTSVPPAEGEAQPNGHHAANGVRPASRSSGSIMDDKKAKRASGFFRRLRSSDRTTQPSQLYAQSNASHSRPEIRGPPPPMIPELSALESKVDVTDGGSLGSDLFKNIK